MNRTGRSALVVLLIALAAACNKPQPAPQPARTRAPAPSAPAGPAATASAAAGGAEAEVRAVVAGFGKQLQLVSLLSPSAAQELQAQYAPFVAPDLLETWAGNPSKAPGRLVSSPWPDHIEIASVTEEQPDKYAVSGFVVEVTSMEVVSGGAAARIPVHIELQKTDGRWLITAYAEER